MTDTLTVETVANLAALYRADARRPFTHLPTTGPYAWQVASELRERGRGDVRDALAREATLEAHLYALQERMANTSALDLDLTGMMRKTRVLNAQLRNIRVWVQWLMDFDAPAVGAQSTSGDLIHRERSFVSDMTICGARIFRPVDRRWGFTERCTGCWGAQ